MALLIVLLFVGVFIVDRRMNAVAQRCAFNLTSSSSDASSHKAKSLRKKLIFERTKVA
jgi:hypothetical protein